MAGALGGNGDPGALADGLQALLLDPAVSLSALARTLDRAGLTPAAVGTFVHKAGECRTLSRLARKVAAGDVMVEMRVETADGAHGEIDLVRIGKGNRHFIYDYKPVNLADIARSAEFGPAFTAWLRDSCDGDYTRFGFRHGDAQMPPALQRFVRDAVAAQIAQHRAQLDAYRQAYERQLADPDARVMPPIVIPYWVWR